MSDLPLSIAGLGPGSWVSTPFSTKELVTDPGRAVIVRTIDHPAARHLAGLRDVVSCDDLYLSGVSFEDVYQRISERVLASALARPTVYAVPGSPLIGELAVALIRAQAAKAGLAVEVIDAESFLEAVLAAVGYDPLDRGLRLLNGHRLPAPLVVDSPTVIAHLDHPIVLTEVLSSLGRVLPEDTQATLVIDAGGEDARLLRAPLDQLDPHLAGLRTSLFIDPEPGGLVGAVRTMWRLREECPWDRKQTHSSLVKNLVEESYELIEAIGANEDGSAYGAVEDELGDVLLQVLFLAAIARQEGAFDIDDVAENLRQKLVRRHPHIFGTVEADTADEVKANWERIKAEERGGSPESMLDGVPLGMPALERAAKLGRRAAQVGFDWPDVAGVLAKLDEELGELRAVVADQEKRADEVGDLLFTMVNLSRHLDLDPELALRAASRRFEDRFRLMEKAGSLTGLSAAELDERWEAAKRAQFRG